MKRLTVPEDILLFCRVKIRGHKDDTATLSTQGKTYDIREAHTSNSILLVPSCYVGTELEAQTHIQLKHTQVYNITHKLGTITVINY